MTYQKEDAVGIALSVSGREVVLVSRSTRPGVPEGDRGWENSMETGASPGTMEHGGHLFFRLSDNTFMLL